MSDGAKAILGLLWIPIGALLSGWAMVTLWGWFIVPLGASALGLAHGWGLSMMVHYYTSHTPDKRELWDIILSSTLQTLLVLGFCWIAKNLM